MITLLCVQVGPLEGHPSARPLQETAERERRGVDL